MPRHRPTRHGRGALLVTALVVLVSTGLAPAVRLGAAPGDPLPEFGDGGALEITAPDDCDPCPAPYDINGRTLIETRGETTVVGYEWIIGPADPEALPVTGSAVAVIDDGDVGWTVALPSHPSVERTLLAVGTRPGSDEVIAVVGVVDPDAVGEDSDGVLRQEVHRFSSSGMPRGVDALPVGTHGAWTLAEVAPDGSLVGVVEHSEPSGLPRTEIRRVAIDGTFRWTATLPVGAFVDALAVSADGGVVAAGSKADGTSFDGIVAGWSDAGSPIASYGTGGVRTFPAREGFGLGFVDVDAVGADVALAGIEQWQEEEEEDVDSTPGRALVVRLRDGAPVTAFSGDGVAERRWGNDTGQRIDPRGILLDGQRVLLSGTQYGADADGTRALLDRYRADGSIDPQFAIGGSDVAGLDALARVDGGYAAVALTFEQRIAWAVDVRGFAAEGTGTSGPAAPTGLEVISAGAQGVEVGWTEAPGAAGYELHVDIDGDGLADQVDDLPTGTSTQISGIPPDHAVRIALRTRGSGGLGRPSAWSAPAIPPFRTVDAFSDRQVRDILGRASTTAERAEWRAAIDAGTRPSARIDALIAAPTWSVLRDPVIRLYRAYFLRLPDTGGLDYWVAEARRGRTIGNMSQAFSASPEFRTRYGTLTNRQFVELIYRNILGRPGEPAGVDYWTDQLDGRRKGRGAVMIGFSESPENRGRFRPTVDVVHAYTALLRRVPRLVEAQLWEPHLRAGNPRTDVIAHLLGTPEYDERIL